MLGVMIGHLAPRPDGHRAHRRADGGRALPLVLVTLSVVALVGAGVAALVTARSGSASSRTATSDAAAATTSVTTGAATGTAGASAADATSSPTATADVPATGASDGDGTTATATAAGRVLSDADRAAGLTSLKVPDVGTGRLVTVKGSVKAPGKGTVKTVRVRIEGGLGIDGQSFAAFVMDTLNDERSWGHGGTMTFARTASASADITVVLASPDTSAAMCAPLVTYGKLSCRTGSKAVLTLYRWVKAIPGYRPDYTGYRHYVINHEVGHTLGHGHEYCAGKGERAPLMMQQTKGLKGCKANPWPYPDAG